MLEDLPETAAQPTIVTLCDRALSGLDILDIQHDVNAQYVAKL